MKMHEKYRFFSLYIVQKRPKIFLYEPKKLSKLQKKTLFSTTVSAGYTIHVEN